jgi:hypothetical protein
LEFGVRWKRHRLKDGSREGLTYTADLGKISQYPGVYILARRWGAGFEALYVGKATKLRSRIKSQFNNHRLMNHLENASNGARVIYVGEFNPKPGQRLAICLSLIEKALIRYFVSEDHDIVNKQGKKLKQHTIVSNGSFPRSTMSAEISVER